MKNRKLIVAVVALVVVIAAILLLKSRPAPAPPAVPSPAAPEPLAPPALPPTATSPAPPPAEAIAPSQHAPEQGAQVTPPVVARVGAGQILATVNNVPIMLKDLMALAPGDMSSEQRMEPDVYESRLNRAIEAELTFQAARSQNVNLTDEQQLRLQHIRDKAAADIEAYKSQGMTWTSIKPEQLEFEERMTSALLLQQNLVAKAGGPSPQEAEAYAESLRKLLNQLRAAANIAVNRPPF
jgi:hypothetical protein